MRAAAAGATWWWGFRGRLDPGVVAMVGDLPVTMEEVERRASLVRLAPAGEGDDQSLAVEIRRAVVAELVNQRLLLIVARGKGIRVTDAEVAAERKRLLDSFTPEDRQKVLEEAGMTAGDLDHAIRENLTIAGLMSGSEAGPPSEADIRAYYEAHQDEFFRSETVRARAIVTATQTDAREARSRLMRGEDFIAVAKAVSQGPAADQGGDLGYFERGQLPKDLEDWVFSLKPGAVSPVIDTPYGYHIIRVEEHLPAGPAPLEEVRGRIVEQIREEREEKEIAALLAELGKKVRITYNRRHAELAPSE
jgi:parvulin-like peptidyl-prolyl isomerase